MIFTHHSIVRVHDLRYMEEICLVEAHDGEVLALEYFTSKTGKIISFATFYKLISNVALKVLETVVSEICIFKITIFLVTNSLALFCTS